MSLRTGLAGLVLLTSACQFLQPPRVPPLVPVRASLHPDLTPDSLRQIVVLPFEAGKMTPAEVEVTQQAFLSALRGLTPFHIILPPAPDRDHEVALDRSGLHEGIPVRTLVRLHRELGADAVLFGEVTFHRTVGEPAAGVRLHLFDARDGRCLWMADDILDATTGRVRRSFQEFLLRSRYCNELESESTDQVPFRWFADFVASSFLDSLRGAVTPPPPLLGPEGGGDVAGEPSGNSSWKVLQ